MKLRRCLQILHLLSVFLVSVATLAAEITPYEVLVELAESYGIDSSGNRLVLEARLRELLEISEGGALVIPRAGDPLASVESADSGEYRQLDTGDELILQGGVTIVVESPEFNAVHRISAERIVYNPELRQLSAEGGVSYRMVSSDQDDQFSGDRLLFLLDDNETLFIAGQGSAEQAGDSEAIDILTTLGGSATTSFEYEGELITRNQNNLVIMDNGEVHSAEGTPGGYRLTFTKLWILSAGEWGIQGAQIWIGNIPVFAFPFLYLPGNEIVFHPVFLFGGTRGYGLQTTTYFAGQRPTSDSSFSFLQLGGDAEVTGSTRMGIYLQPDNSVEPETWVNTNFSTYKLYLDIFPVRGIYAGVEFEADDNYLPSGIALLALTREMYYSSYSSGMTGYFTDSDGNTQSIWNTTDVAGYDIPLRYILALDGNIDAGIFSLSYDIPVYSDPYIAEEAADRAEQMDWSGTGFSTSTIDEYDETDMEWSVGLGIDAYTSSQGLIRSASISGFDTEFNWTIEDDDTAGDENTSAMSSPQTLRYFPEQWQLPSGSASVSGVLLEFTDSKTRATSDSTSGEEEWDTQSGDRFASPEFQSPPIEGDRDAVQEESVPTEPTDGFILPDAPSFSPLFNNSRYSYTLGYSASSNYTLTMLFHDIDESENPLASYYRYQNSISSNLTQKISAFYGLLAMNSSAAYHLSYRDNFGFSDLVDSTTINSLETAAYAQYSEYASITNTTSLNILNFVRDRGTLTAGHSITLKPWVRDRSNSGVFSIDTFSWDSDYVSAHSVSLDYRLRRNAVTQTLGFDYSLPPLDEDIALSYSLSSEYFDLALATSAELEVFDWNEATIDMEFRPLEELYLEIDTDLDPWNRAVDKIEGTLGYRWLEGNLVLEERDLLELDSSATYWSESGESAFTLSTAEFSLDLPIELGERDGTNFSLNIGSNYSQDFVEYTDSVLDFELDLNILIPRVLLLRLATSSENSQMYRYIPSYASGLNLTTKNFFTDTLKSFNFFNRQDRLDSAFNVEAISFELYHDIGDWMLSLQYDWAPSLTTASDGTKEYQFDSTIRFFLQWLPIGEISTEIEIDQEDDEITVNY